ncbi:MAG TPA: CopG family transcriptional regulator [Ruminiclostridium sp.]|nr:CopG family transcriptional regulator [Ruminiclostridium sp.]
MSKPKANTKVVNVFLPEDVHKQIKVEAESRGTSVSGMIRMIILEYLQTKK